MYAADSFLLLLCAALCVLGEDVMTSSSSSPTPLRPEYAHPAGAEALDPYNSERLRPALAPLGRQDEDDELEGRDKVEGVGGSAQGESALVEDRLPQGSFGELPMFLSEPQRSFVVRNRPARLRCRAANALQLYFKCNDVRVHSETLSEFVDPQTGVRNMEIEYNVTREQLVEYFGDEFVCECYAWSSRSNIKSRPAVVQLSYLKKQFLLSPAPSSVSAGTKAILKCSPPIGVPLPKVIWLRQGQPLLPAAGVRMSGSDLHIQHADLQDMANYSCVAENIAAKRVSDPALLTVYVNGGWSSWGAWAACRCGGRQRGRRRTRSCTEPQALNGGAPCSGPGEQATADCLLCHTAEENGYVGSGGRWGPWSTWGACGLECRQTRTRRCVSSRCAGQSTQLASCVGDYCRPSGEGMGTAAMAVVGVGAAAAVMAAIAIGALLWKGRRKKRRRSARDADHQTETYPVMEKQPLAPDLTLHRPPSRDDHHHYDVPHLAASYSCPRDRRSRPPSSSSCSPQRYDGKPYSDSEHSSGCYTSSDSTCEMTDPCAVQLCSLVSDSRWARSGAAGEELRLCGGRVTMSAMGGGGGARRVYAAISRDDGFRPRLGPGMTQLSPVVRCGPPCAQLTRPAVLRLPHCAVLDDDRWDLSLYAVDSEADDRGVAWRRAARIGKETIDTSASVHVEKDAVYILSDSLTAFVLVGESSAGDAVKALRVSLYSSPRLHDGARELRLYLCEDASCADYYCDRYEEGPRGEQLISARVLLRDGGEDLCIDLNCANEDWKMTSPATYRIPFRQLWSARHNVLRYSFTVRCAPGAVGELAVTLTAGQRGAEVRAEGREGLRAGTDEEEMPQWYAALLTERVLRALSCALDVPAARGDWRDLHSALGGRYAAWLAARSSPARLALSLWAARTPASSGALVLMSVLREIGRPELCEALMRCASVSDGSSSSCPSSAAAWL